jgi:molybdate transport system substrate-binding protein
MRAVKPLLFAIAAALLGCPAGAPTELRALVAASLAEPARALAADFERQRPGVRVLVSAGSSSALERQVEAGARADVFVSAAEEPVDRLVARGLLDPATRVVVATNALVVVVPAGLPAPASLDDLAGLERVAVGQRGVPVGDYARQALERAGLAASLEAKLAGYPDEPAVLTAVAAGAAPAGIVYASSLVVHAARDRVARAFVIDPALHAPIVYPGAVGATSTNPALARAFLEHLTGPESRAALARAGLGAAR